MKNIYSFLFYAGISLLLVITYVFVKSHTLISDEGAYYKASYGVASFTFSQQIEHNITIFPTYYIVLGIIIFFSGLAHSGGSILIAYLRGIMVVVGFLTVASFSILARHEDSQYRIQKTLKFLCNPFIFPFFFLIYSDIPTLFFLLLSYASLLKRRYILSGILGAISVLIRQDNAIWLLFFASYIFIGEQNILLTKKFLLGYLKRTWIYFFALILLGIFAIANKGNFGYGDVEKHPFSFHLGNVYLFLLFVWMLYLPFMINKVPKILIFVRKHTLWTVLTALILLSIFTYHADHPYNAIERLGYLRNDLLRLITINIYTRFFTYILLLWSTLSLFTIQLYQKRQYILYLFIFISLSLHWLVEPRYLIIPLTFLLLYMKEKTTITSDLVMFIHITLTAVTMVLIFRFNLFL